ncbi:glycosyl hydrolase family 3 [Bacillus sp. ISL-34]|uniref:glycoside hydrolase family 3 N-terminal domain-containing protein n=1 Tax=Bacillus sp. ISL-34 TaxID=2819121 RepID=UPI001BE552D5|nr:glycoside hydrolase family 3 N-terminal domain-containing protein [Bacillus sp. ISL-34]MBT2646268.1 glycosyl hydrolase family 3 [Bacillus sp. ISL-34]
MKNKNIYWGLLFITILAFTVVFIQLNMDVNSRAEKGKDAEAEKIEKLLKKMTLEEKIGQLMMVGFKGTEKGSEITELIEQKHIGGVIYFDRNMKSPKQVARLSNSLQQTADQSTHSLPLMVAIDQEGGEIIRMKERVSPLPAQQDLGNNASVEDMYNVAKLNGTELGSMGININFAPVLDLSKTDRRSLGQDPEKVYQYGKKAIQGLNDVSITGALKHFPGNGRSEIDPHVETSSVEANQLDLENSDIYPFKQIISELDNHKFFVMVTHIKYPAYDKEKPASLSKIIIEDLLRGKLKYEGLVVTDDLEMGAVNKYFSYEEMGKQAILAGADLLLVCHEYAHELEVYNGLLQAVKAGEVPMDRINESVKRVLTYKLYNMKQTKADPDQAEKVVKNPESIKYIESLNVDK